MSLPRDPRRALSGWLYDDDNDCYVQVAFGSDLEVVACYRRKDGRWFVALYRGEARVYQAPSVRFRGRTHDHPQACRT